MSALKSMHPSVCFLGFTPGKTEPSDFVDNDMPASRRMEDYQPGQYCIKNQGTKAYLALVCISIADCMSSTRLKTCQQPFWPPVGCVCPTHAWMHGYTHWGWQAKAHRMEGHQLGQILRCAPGCAFTDWDLNQLWST